MNSGEKKEKLLRSLDYIDPGMISGAVRRIDEKKSQIKTARRKHSMIWKIAPLAACLVLICLVIPTITTLIGQPEPPAIVIDQDTHTPLTGVYAENSGGEVETAPVYDGSRGLLYEINEAGTEAYCVGWGNCTDEVVYIASHYNGLPVTSVYNKAYNEASKIPANHSYNSKYVKKLVISDTVIYVGRDFIRQCPNIESIYFGASVEYIPTLYWNSGYGENFATVEVSPDNPYYSSKGNCVVDLRLGQLVLATPTTVIPDDGSVVMIGRSSFCSAKYGLTSIVIPEGVKIIENDAFAGCSKLESVKLPDSLEFIESSAFFACQSLKTLEIGRNLKSINQLSFHMMYCPEIYYKGTIAEWEAIAKTTAGNAKSPAKVICTDGETLSTEGNQNNLWWQNLPEYAELNELYIEIHHSKKYVKYAPYTSPGERYIEIGTGKND